MLSFEKLHSAFDLASSVFHLNVNAGGEAITIA
jgi:hypothetical protein